MADSKIAGKAKRSSAYAQKLKDPRWQRKRLEILERDEWMCQTCYASELTLHVHHKSYTWGNDPWDYPSGNLVTLCCDCHEAETEQRKQSDAELVAVVSRHIHGFEAVDSLSASLDAALAVTDYWTIPGCLERLAERSRAAAIINHMSDEQWTAVADHVEAIFDEAIGNG